MNHRGVGVLVAVAAVMAFSVLFGMPGPMAVPVATLAAVIVYAMSKDTPPKAA